MVVFEQTANYLTCPIINVRNISNCCNALLFEVTVMYVSFSVFFEVLKYVLPLSVC